MPGITLRHFRTFWSVGFMVQDRRLFPESPLRRNGQNCRILCVKLLDSRLLHRARSAQFCRRPSSQCANLQTNDLQGGRVCEQVRIGKDDGLFVLFVYVNVRLTAKLPRELCLNGGAKLFCEENFRPSIGFFVECILLGVGALFPWLVFTISQHPPIQNQINILGKAADQVECFGKAGTAFEGNSIFPGASVEQMVKRKACPKSFSTMASFKPILSAVFRNSSPRSLSGNRATFLIVCRLHTFSVSYHKPNP